MKSVLGGGSSGDSGIERRKVMFALVPDTGDCRRHTSALLIVVCTFLHSQ